MRGNIITIGDNHFDFNQFCEKIESYDIELTRSDIISLLDDIKEYNPSLVPAILNVVKKSYHLNLAY